MLGLALLLGAANASAEAPLTIRVVDPVPISYDVTALGRASHRVRLVFLNESRTARTSVPLHLRIIATRDGITYPCDEPSGGERWPHQVEAHSSITIDASVRCDTPLPGKYDLDVRARPRGAAEGEEHTIATSAINIEPGLTPPVKLPTDARLWVASSTTKELPPAKDASVRIVVGLVNGSKTDVGLPTGRAHVKITRRGVAAAPCPARTIELAFSGTLAGGRMRSVATSIPCDLSLEGTYDVDVTLVAPAQVHLGTHSVRAIAVPLPHPGPTGTLPADLTP